MNETTAAYIAGFLDGDGSIHLQLVRQRQYRYGFYVRVSVSFHQHQTGRKGLEWLKEQLQDGYLRNRSGQMSDYVITSRPTIRRLLRAIAPYVVFKRQQVEQGLKLLDAIEAIDSRDKFLAVARQVEAFKTLNRSKRKINTVQRVLDTWSEMRVLAPVTTDPDLPAATIAAQAGRVRSSDDEDHTPAPRKRVEI